MKSIRRKKKSLATHSVIKPSDYPYMGVLVNPTSPTLHYYLHIIYNNDRLSSLFCRKTDFNLEKKATNYSVHLAHFPQIVHFPRQIFLPIKLERCIQEIGSRFFVGQLSNTPIEVDSSFLTDIFVPGIIFFLEICFASFFSSLPTNITTVKDLDELETWKIQKNRLPEVVSIPIRPRKTLNIEKKLQVNCSPWKKRMSVLLNKRESFLLFFYLCK